MYDSKRLIFFVVPLSTKMKNKFSFKDFLEQYPTEQACLDKVFQMRYGNLMCCPKCAVIDAKFYKLRKRRCYECGECGHHLYPLSGTIMHGSTVPLNVWFYAIFLFAISKNGISSYELERSLGVSYKTALKISRKIRSIMKDGPTKLKGTVHVDESLYGAKAKSKGWGYRKGRLSKIKRGKPKPGWGDKNKTILFGMIETDGRVIIKLVPDRRTGTLTSIIKDNVERNSKIHSDQHEGYHKLGFLDYKHRVKGIHKWTHTNCIEGYWGNLKRSLYGTHNFISRKYLQTYIDEHTFRHSNRTKDNLFELILSKAFVLNEDLPLKKEQAVFVIQQLTEMLRS